MDESKTRAERIAQKVRKKQRMVRVAMGQEKADLVLKNATYVNVFSNELCQGDIAVVGGLVVGMGDYSGVEEVDVTGKVVTPGFIDSHCHIGIWESGLDFEGDDTNEMTDPSTPQVRAIDAVNPRDRTFAEALEYGITTVSVGPGSANPIAGQVCVMHTAGRYVDEMILSAPSAMKFALGENPKKVYNGKEETPVTRMAIAAVIREQLLKARRYQQDLKKSQEDEDTDPPEFDMKCEALLPVLERRIKAHFHAHRADDICTAIRIAKEFDLDAVIIHCTEGHLVTEAIRDSGLTVSVGPIISARTKPELRNMERCNAAKMAAAGIPVALNTDALVFPIDLFAASAKIAMLGGLPWQQALEAMTIRSAEAAGVEKQVGSITVGKRADLLVFDRDPIDLLVKPAAVFVDGICTVCE